MAGLEKKWVRQQKESVPSRLRESLRPPEPLKPKIEKANQEISAQTNKLEGVLARLKEKDGAIMSKVTNSLSKHDTQTGKVYSNELVEIRKMAKLVNQAKVVLEQTGLRISTVKDMGDFVSTLAPVIPVMKKVRMGLVSVMPEAENEIGEVSSALGGLLTEMGQLGSFSMSFEPKSEEAERILAEAAAVAEQRVKDSFPEIPGAAEGEAQKTS